MPRYNVQMRTTTSLSVTVEAECEEDAASLAYEAIPSGICALCSGWGQDWCKDEGEYEVEEDSTLGGILFKAVNLIEE